MGKGRWLNVVAAAVLAAVGLDIARRQVVAYPSDGTLAVPDPAAQRGWWPLVKQVATRCNDHRLMQEAAGVTFFMLLAIFPAIAALVSVYALFADPKTVSDQLGALGSVVPGGGLDLMRDQIRRVATNGAGNLGIRSLIGLLIALWSSNQGTKAMVDVLNVVYDQHEQRSYMRLTSITLLVTFCIILFMAVALGALVVMPVVLQFIGLGPELGLIISLLRWPVLLVAVALVLGVTYHFGPCREREPWRWISWGGSLAAILWLLISFGFSYYVGHFGSYNALYGSLGAVIGFMTWIWISVIVIMLGAELSAELEVRRGIKPVGS